MRLIKSLKEALAPPEEKLYRNYYLFGKVKEHLLNRAIL